LVIGGWWLVEKHMFDVARFVEKPEALREALHIAFQENEAMIDGFPRNSFVFVEFQEGGGVFEVATLALGAVGLDVAELVDGLLELAGEPLVVEAEGGERGNKGLGVRVLGKQLGFERGDAVESPGGVGEFLSELGLGGSGGSVFVDEAAAMGVVRCLVFGREDGGCGR
jgi:hypothetical protein